jgi:hypothetical protein
MRLYIEQWERIAQAFSCELTKENKGLTKKLNKASDRSLTMAETPGYYPRPLERPFLTKCPRKWRF